MATTDLRRTDSVERYNRATRWFHAAVYVPVLVLLGTGWWLWTGQEGNPSWLADLVGVPDTRLHTWVGWATVGVLALGLVLGARAAVTFTRESVRVERGDLRWLVAWPKATLTGRFPHHEGHFDPGQRIANVVLVALLTVLLVSGGWLTLVHGGPTFVVLHRLHVWSTYAVTPVLLGHILIASGLLPGYRGVWRSMHLGGRLPADVARRLWPGWTTRTADRR